jgi:ribosome recycling factor
VRKKAEDGKVAVRNARHKTVDELKVLHKEHKITDDDQKRATDQIQKMTDRYCKDLDGLLASKEKEIMEV